MIKNVFYLIFIFSFFLLIIKCEYITSEKKEKKFEEDNGNYHKRDLGKYIEKEIKLINTNNKNESIKKEKNEKNIDVNEENKKENNRNKSDVISTNTNNENENKKQIKKGKDNIKKKEYFLLEYKEEIEKYDDILDEIILRNMSKKNCDYFNILEEYSFKTKLSSDMYDSLKDLIKIINRSNIPIHSYNEKKKYLKYNIKEHVFKKHFILSLFRWYNSFKLIETCFNKTNYIFYIDDHKIYSYKYTYKLVLNLLNSENFLYYINLNKLSLMKILDYYNKYNFKINNTIRNYPSHMYVSESFNDFIYSYFTNYKHQFFEKHKHIIDREVWNNKITTSNTLFHKLKKLNNNLILYKLKNDSNVNNYVNKEMTLILSTFKEFLIDILNNLYNDYYYENLKFIQKRNKLKKDEEHNKIRNTYNDIGRDTNINRRDNKNMNTDISNNYEENKEKKVDFNRNDDINLNEGNYKTREYYNDNIKEKNEKSSNLNNPHSSISEKKGNNKIDIDNIEKDLNKLYEHIYDENIKYNNMEKSQKKGEYNSLLEHIENKNIDKVELTELKDDDNEMWKNVVESYNKISSSDEFKKYNKYILKNLHKIFNISSEKGDESYNFKNKYELKDGYIVNNITDKHIPLLFNPIKDIFTCLSKVHIKEKINFKHIYKYLLTIYNYKEGQNFYDKKIQCRSGLFFKEDFFLRNYQNKEEEIKNNVTNLIDKNKKLEKKFIFELDEYKDNDSFPNNKWNENMYEEEVNEHIGNKNIKSKSGSNNVSSKINVNFYDYYNNINLSAYTPAAVTPKERIHDQLKLLRTKFVEKLKSEANCALAFLFLIGMNDHNGKLQFPYGFPRNIDKSINLIRKGKDGLCNFLSGILYHVNLPIFVNNSSISITTEANDELIGVNENSINSFFYIYYKNKTMLRNHDFLSDENRIISNTVDNIKSKIVSYSLGSTKEDFYSKLAFTNNIIRLKYKNKINNAYLKDYFDFTYDNKDYKNSVIKNNLSPFLTSCDYLLSNILGVIVDSIKVTSSIESGIYEEYISENHKNLIRNNSDNNKNLYEYFLKLADSRNSYALAALGEIYFLGNEHIGIERDEQKAFEYWKKAADQGDSISALSTGYAYLDEYKKFSKKEELMKNMNKEEIINMIQSENSGNGKKNVNFEMNQESNKKKKNDKNEKKNEKNSNNNKEEENSNDSYSFFSSINKDTISNTSVSSESTNSLNNMSNNSISSDQSYLQNNSGNFNFFINGTTNLFDFSNNTHQGNSTNVNMNNLNNSNMNVHNNTTENNISINKTDAYIQGINVVHENNDNRKNHNNAKTDNREETVQEDKENENDEIIKEYMLNLNNKANNAFKNAEHYFHKAIRNNDGSLESILAKYNIYKFGLGRKVNVELAGYYLKKAAEKGDNISQMLLGHYYSGTDIGIKLSDYKDDKIENLKKSYKYYALSAKNGNLISLYNKSILILKGINPKYKTFNEKCEQTLKHFHFIGLFNERIYVLTKLLKRNYEFKDYTGSLLLSIMLSELGDHPNNVNASMLWDLKKKTMQTFTEKYNIIENILKNFNVSLRNESKKNNSKKKVTNDFLYNSNNIDQIIKRIYNKEKKGKYTYKNKSKINYGSLMKNCVMINSIYKINYFLRMKYCYYLKQELLQHKARNKNYKQIMRNHKHTEQKKTVHDESTKEKVSGSNKNTSEKKVSYYDIYNLTKLYGQIELFEKYDKIIINEMKKEKNIDGKIKKIKKMKNTILEHFRITEFLHCYFKPISYYQIKLEEEKRMKQYYNNNYLKNKNMEKKDLEEYEFKKYSTLLENHDIQEIHYYKKKYTSNIFEEIQSFSKNCDVCKQYYDIYSAYYGYKKSTIDLVKKYHEGDEFTIKSKRKQLQYLIKDSDAHNHESLYYKALFLEHNNLDNLQNILQIYFKLATDNHNACNIVGILGILKIFFKKVFFDINIFNKKKKNHFPLNTYRDFNKCPLQTNFLFKTDYDQMCFNFDYLFKSNYIYSQIVYLDFFKVLYNLISSFFKIK